MVTKSTSDKNSMRISGLDICATETRSTVEISSLRVTGLSLHCEGVLRKGLIVDNDGIRLLGLGISCLEGISSSLYCERHL